MKQKNFLKIRILIAILLGVIFGASLPRGNYILPITAFIAAISIFYITKKKVKGILADERDNKIGGIAAKLAFSIYPITAVIIGSILIAMGKNQPDLLYIGYTLSYSVCFLLISYVIFFKYYNKRGI